MVCVRVITVIVLMRACGVVPEQIASDESVAV